MCTSRWRYDTLVRRPSYRKYSSVRYIAAALLLVALFHNSYSCGSASHRGLSYSLSHRCLGEAIAGLYPQANSATKYRGVLLHDHCVNSFNKIGFVGKIYLSFTEKFNFLVEFCFFFHSKCQLRDIIGISVLFNPKFLNKYSLYLARSCKLLSVFQVLW